MKALQSLVAILILLSAVCHGQHCPNPKLQRATIGGDTIRGYVGLQQGPLENAKVRLLSNGKNIWAGSTSDVGSFQIDGLQPGTYRLAVKGWGSATIRISPDLTHSFGYSQALNYSLWLRDNGCVWVITAIN